MTSVDRIKVMMLVEAHLLAASVHVEGEKLYKLHTKCNSIYAEHCRTAKAMLSDSTEAGAQMDRCASSAVSRYLDRKVPIGVWGKGVLVKAVGTGEEGVDCVIASAHAFHASRRALKV